MTVYIFTSFPNLPDRMEKTELVAASIAKGEEEMRKRYPHMKATGDDTYILDAKVRVLGKEQKLLGKVREYTMVE